MFTLLAIIIAVLALVLIGLLTVLIGGGAFMVIFGDAILAIAVIVLIVRHFVKK